MARLKTRIDALEQATCADGLSSDALKLLVGLLAKLDAMFLPWRTRGIPVAVYRRQRDYLAEICGLSAKADGQHEWKNAHFMRQELVRHGMVNAAQSSGQITSLYLTQQGLALAQAHVWDCPGQLGEWQAAAHVLLSKMSVDTNRKWISESQLFGLPCTGDPSDWTEYTGRMLPLLIGGLVSANSDSVGRVYYSVTDKPFPQVEQVEIPNVKPELTDVYLDAFGAERTWLTNVEPADGNEIVIPIPASGW